MTQKELFDILQNMGCRECGTDNEFVTRFEFMVYEFWVSPPQGEYYSPAALALVRKLILKKTDAELDITGQLPTVKQSGALPPTP
jgi:hypothetical protein